MLRSYWLRNPAITGCLAFVLVIGLVAYLAYRPSNQSPNQQTQQEHSYSQQKSNGNSEKAEVSPFVSSEDTLAQWIMAFFGVVATGVSAWAVLLLKRTLEVTQDAVAEAREATAAANKTADTTDKIGKRQLRAYVDAVSASIEFREPGPYYEIPAPSECEIHASGVIKNTGQTPARHLEVWVACACEPQPFREDWLTEFRPEGRGNLGAGQHGDVQATVGISRAERIAALAGDHTVWFFGGISYRDVFDDEWTTSFRLQWDPKTKKLVHSPQGNEAT